MQGGNSHPPARAALAGSNNRQLTPLHSRDGSRGTHVRNTRSRDIPGRVNCAQGAAASWWFTIPYLLLSTKQKGDSVFLAQQDTVSPNARCEYSEGECEAETRASTRGVGEAKTGRNHRAVLANGW